MYENHTGSRRVRITDAIIILLYYTVVKYYYLEIKRGRTVGILALRVRINHQWRRRDHSIASANEIILKKRNKPKIVYVKGGLEWVEKNK